MYNNYKYQFFIIYKNKLLCIVIHHKIHNKIELLFYNINIMS